MILKSIKIENIRSIKKIELEFNLSISLFYGDIGAGKSTILKSIEFALFGTLIHSDLKGESLLRRGENKASVELNFIIDKNEYIIKRFLSRSSKGKVSQTKDSYIIENGEKLSLSSTELRKKVLKILNYPIIRYEKAQKIPLFRYTVYTPQEQVKEILQADPEERFEILKDVFGIEKYEIALKNIDILKDTLYRNIREYEGRIKQVGNPEILIPQKEKDYKVISKRIQEDEIKLKSKEDKIELKENELEILQLQWNEYRTKSTEINRKDKKFQEDLKSKDENRNALKILNEEILEKENERKKLKTAKVPIKLSQKEINQKLSEIRNSLSEFKQERAIKQNKFDDIDNLLKKGKCSLCGQKIHEIKRFENEKSKSLEEIDRLSSSINTFIKDKEHLEKTSQKLIEFNEKKVKAESIDAILNEKKKRKENLLKLIDELDKNKSDIKLVLKGFGIENFDEFKAVEKRVTNEYESLKSDLRNLKNQRETIIRDNSSDKREMEFIQKEIKNLNDSIEIRKNFQAKLDYMKDIRDWIANNFKELLRRIERKILASSAIEFNEYFKEWFKILIEGENIEVEIRTDDFQPIINVNGHQTPFSDLSGGEKSSLSLAYRLALNKIINDRYQEIKTKNLLILDEPTDGFSQEQINRMQLIFENLNMAQIIVISHDTNLDSFVTDIFNFKKEFHETKITKGKSQIAEEPTVALKSFDCPECAANLSIKLQEGNLIVCEYCKKPFLMEW